MGGDVLLAVVAALSAGGGAFLAALGGRRGSGQASANALAVGDESGDYRRGHDAALAEVQTRERDRRLEAVEASVQGLRQDVGAQGEALSDIRQQLSRIGAHLDQVLAGEAARNERQAEVLREYQDNGRQRDNAALIRARRRRSSAAIRPPVEIIGEDEEGG